MRFLVFGVGIMGSEGEGSTTGENWGIDGESTHVYFCNELKFNFNTLKDYYIWNGFLYWSKITNDE
jgi:hypothetical protein